MSVIGPDGSYKLTTFDAGDGAMLGRFRVTIKAVRVVGGAPIDDVRSQGSAPLAVAAESALPTIEWLVPENYSRPETSPLTAEVKRGSNTFNFDL